MTFAGDALVVSGGSAVFNVFVDNGDWCRCDWCR